MFPCQINPTHLFNTTGAHCAAVALKCRSTQGKEEMKRLFPTDQTRDETAEHHHQGSALPGSDQSIGWFSYILRGLALKSEVQPAQFPSEAADHGGYRRFWIVLTTGGMIT